MRLSRYPLNIYFFLAGFATANLTVRIPALKDQIGASGTELGLALLCMSLGGVVAMTQGGRLCLHFGTRRVMIVAALAVYIVVSLPALAQSVPILGLTLALYGTSYGVFNISLNSAAVDLEKAMERPVMSGLHGLFSTGALGGALVGGLAAAHLSVGPHLMIITGLGLVITVIFVRPLLARDPHLNVSRAERHASNKGGSLGLVVKLMAVVAFCTAFTEFSSNDWSVLHLRDDLGASPMLAAYGYAAYECAIALTRLTGGKLIKALGEAVILVGGSLLATVGILIAAWAGHLPGGLPLAFAGYLLMGIGVANLFPIAIARAGALGGPRAVSVVAPLSTIGIMVERPVLGFLSDQVGLPTALSGVIVLTLISAGIGITVRRHLRPRHTRTVAPALATELAE